MLEIKNLSIKKGDNFLVRDLSFTLTKNDKLAIIGEEGNGKSTLLKSILGLCEYAEVTGSIAAKGNRIGYLEQSLQPEKLEKTVFNFLFKNEKDYYEKISSLYKYFEIISLKDEILYQKLANLSGGEKVKIGILKLLLDEDDILFLDEPTNDLDIETLEWLEEFINETTKPILFVSHDETLLSNTANMILHLEQIDKKTECRHTLVPIDYDTYVEERLKKIDKQTQLSKTEKREYEIKKSKLNRIMQKVDYQQDTISRSNPAGAAKLKKKMHSLKSQERKLENMSLTEIPDVEEGINFFFEPISIPKGKTIIKLDLPELKIGQRVLAKNIKLEIVGNPHVCITGQNGVGKTTLIKHIYDELKTRDDIKVGYMPQNYEDILSKYDRVLDFVASKNKEERAIACTRLASMKLTQEEIRGKIETLSNGTKAKLFLMKLVLDKCDVLVLDEPTRNVSPLSNPVIRRVLKNYGGAIISVSHDRKFIDEVVTDLYLLKEDGLHKER